MLESEFQFFKSESPTFDYTIKLELSNIPQGLIPKLFATKISQNSITYDDGPVRWNDYFGKALTYLNAHTGQAIIYSPKIDFLHELSYLLILSLSGKRMDEMGLHKIHACGIQSENKNVLIMLPSKGGKTTLFLNICENYPVKLISDDTPVIDSNGFIHPFPLRIGVEEIPDFLGHHTYPLFKREHFSSKYLIPLQSLNRSIYQPDNATSILIIGVRANGELPQIYAASLTQAYVALFENMIIGVGLPIVIEYFVKNNWRDWIKLIKIFFKRSKAAISLWKRSKTYFFVMSSDPKENSDFLIKSLKNL